MSYPVKIDVQAEEVVVRDRWFSAAGAENSNVSSPQRINIGCVKGQTLLVHSPSLSRLRGRWCLRIPGSLIISATMAQPRPKYWDLLKWSAGAVCREMAGDFTGSPVLVHPGIRFIVWFHQELVK